MAVSGEGSGETSRAGGATERSSGDETWLGARRDVNPSEPPRSPLARLRQLLRRERRRYRELQDFAEEAFLLTDAGGRIREANRRAGELLGASAGDLQEREIEEFVPEGRREEFRRRIEEIRASGDRTRFRFAVEPPGDSPVPVDVVAERLGTSSEDRPRRIRWGLRDATERRRAERTESVLRQQQEARAEAERVARRSKLLAEVTGLLSHAPLRYHEALDEVARLVVDVSHADRCVVWLHEEGEVDRVGDALAEDGPVRLPARFREDFGLDGVSVTETVGRVLESAEIWELSEGTGAEDGSRRVERREEPSGVCRGLLVPISAGDAPLGVLGLFDLGVGPGFGDEELAFARELAERAALGVESARLYREAKRALRERDSVQSMATHDLRNGLTNLALALDDLRHGLPDGDELHASLDQADRSLDRMTRLIDDLDPSLVEEEPGRLRRERVDLEDLAREVLATHEVAAGRNQLDLDLEAEDDLPAVTADPERMRQVLDNLVQNSVKFTPQEGRVVVRLRPDGESVAVSVVDSGPGLPLENRHRIFDRFWRADEAADVEGSGLGLSIVKTLVHAHGGTISARNRDEGGAEITFTLPVEPDVPEDGPATESPEPDDR